ncbi:MAG: DUF5666 domain-containing protein [Anaerolineales bacterium]|jgi:hypothetical protein
MFKKIGFASLIAALAAVTVAIVVSADTPDPAAQGPDHGPRPRLMIGTVLEIGTSDFKVEDLRGETHQITVTDETVFRSRNGEPADGIVSEASFDDLSVGMYVGIHQIDGEAKLVALLPEDFDPEALRGIKLAGEVNMVTVGGGFFKIDTRQGETLTITVDENTRYLGLDGLDDLRRGDKVGVLAQEQEDGTLLAKALGAPKGERPKLDRQGGKLTGIDGLQITITDREGKTHSFMITDQTRFGSRNGEVDGLEDLELDMVLMVIIDYEQEDQAKAVLVVDPAILNQERTYGEVHNTTNGKLTIAAGEEMITFIVDEDTRIRGRKIEGLDDLSKGMKVLVIYQTMEDDTLLAKGILAGVPREHTPQQPDILP